MHQNKNNFIGEYINISNNIDNEKRPRNNLLAISCIWNFIYLLIISIVFIYNN